MNEHSSAVRPNAMVEPRPSPGRSKCAPETAAAPFAGHLAGEPVSPAQEARAAREGRPDLAGRPFGAIVSLLARGQDLPAAREPAPVAPAGEVGVVQEPRPSAQATTAGTNGPRRALLTA
jgi:hypothetical protein